MDLNQNFIEIYKLHSELADRISQRRTTTNQFYIGILSAIFLSLPFLLSKDLVIQVNINKLILFVAGLGILICIVWVLNIASLRRLNSDKFLVLHELEEKLPFAFFQKEWNLVRSKRHLTQSTVEKLVPFVFGSIFFLIIIYSLVFM
jgi:hypothetical protein